MENSSVRFGLRPCVHGYDYYRSEEITTKKYFSSFSLFHFFLFYCLSKQILIDVVNDAIKTADCRKTSLTSYIQVVNDVRRWPLRIRSYPGHEWRMRRTLLHIRVVNTRYTSRYCPSKIDSSQSITLLCSSDSLLTLSGTFCPRITRAPFIWWNFEGFHEPGEATSILSFFFRVLFIS